MEITVTFIFDRKGRRYREKLNKSEEEKLRGMVCWVSPGCGGEEEVFGSIRIVSYERYEYLFGFIDIL